MAYESATVTPIAIGLPTDLKTEAPLDQIWRMARARLEACLHELEKLEDSARQIQDLREALAKEYEVLRRILQAQDLGEEKTEVFEGDHQSMVTLKRAAAEARLKEQYHDARETARGVYIPR
jgi:hypothetical protein